jgi:hypothetical protein
MTTGMTAELHDELLIRRLVERWAVWRDAGDWDRFATVWHPDGVMMATWFQGPFAEFIRVTQEGWAKGVSILHFLGGSAIEVAGDRAIAQTKMTISQRGLVEGVPCDIVCTGRFYDFVQRHEGQWKLLHRQPIYEKDRIDPIDPASVPALDAARLATFPEGYRHLAYIQTGIGYTRQAGHADAQGPGGRRALPPRRTLAGRRAAGTLNARRFRDAQNDPDPARSTTQRTGDRLHDPHPLEPPRRAGCRCRRPGRRQPACRASCTRRASPSASAARWR